MVPYPFHPKPQETLVGKNISVLALLGNESLEMVFCSQAKRKASVFGQWFSLECPWMSLHGSLPFDSFGLLSSLRGVSSCTLPSSWYLLSLHRPCLPHCLITEPSLALSTSYRIDFPGRFSFTSHDSPSPKSSIPLPLLLSSRSHRCCFLKLFFSVSCPIDFSSYELGQYFLNLLLVLLPASPLGCHLCPSFASDSGKSSSLWLGASPLFPACRGMCAGSPVGNCHFKALLQDIKRVY